MGGSWDKFGTVHRKISWNFTSFLVTLISLVVKIEIFSSILAVKTSHVIYYKSYTTFLLRK